ncbi:hypothetical protein BBOV_II003850 [Babesia bovis T2Bo]|uniref:Uncharacterized protein n=1 Tax=Babesia bovis TaxID=5865 RepID=A7ATS9_BABBO|nr:hypothetical protein BBOV_II003850 [Babesia bovis T2Bo]EDO06340.1 hypothetical protein BBOV_II003850 [Babesia bovis T2Bo]|eukprot:XP_001609908.1 hypothetical protein [Babesia bovis T2Bo]
MSLFGYGNTGVRDSYVSPVLSPNKWTRNGRKPIFNDSLNHSGTSWLPPMNKYNDNAKMNSEPVQPWNSFLDKPSEGIYGSSPDISAFRSRLLDSPGRNVGLDVPAYLRSVDTKRYSYTPKRVDAFAHRSVSPRLPTDYLNNDSTFNFKSPTLSRRPLLSRSNGITVPDLRYGSYTMPSHSTSAMGRYGTTMDLHTSPQPRSRINIHATDDILNRIKRSLSECENITRRLDRQYGSRRSEPPVTDYGERVFPRSLADNLFSSRGQSVPVYRNGLNLSRSSIDGNNDDFKMNEVQEHEKPKGALTRILENIKNIRNRALFKATEDTTGKRNFIEIDKEVIESPRPTRRPRTVDVEAIQRRIKEQKRALLSQRTTSHYD